ncbi:MAG TPA: biotin/lipoyl-containing protein [Acidobacteriota bacterium]|nr:biotin/lipoyl-containing protein [Acidobacteriota bacterium]
MKKTVLFICVHNSARSQMAEGLVNSLLGDRFEAVSAGVSPTRVHPAAVKAMAESGIDISGHRSKSLDVFEGRRFDYVVMVCDDKQADCPFFPGGKEQIHHAFDDPAACAGTDKEVLACFRRVRDEIRAWIEEMFVRGVLELAVDKFRFRFPVDLLYSEAGVWVRFEGSKAQLGISDFTQQRNGDVAFVEAKEPGTKVKAGDEVAVVETIKVNLSIPSPLAGQVLERNGDLLNSPELVNLDPYGRGWLAALDVADIQAARASLLTAAEFMALAKAEAEAEVRR